MLRSIILSLPFVVGIAQAEDTIVVTAERRAAPIEDAPASIAVVDSDKLRRINADHIAEALARAPGVNLHRGSGAEHLTAIRSPVLTGGAGAGSFLFLENGVALRSAGFANVNGLFDANFEIADQIEIVRGPSGALYGANAIHGVINVLTPKPGAGLSVFAEVFGDTEARFKGKGVISGGNQAQQFLAGVSVTSEAGYRENAGLDQQKFNLRHFANGDAYTIDTIFSFVNTEQETAGFIFGRDTLFDRDARRTNDFPQAYRDAKSLRLQSTLALNLDEKTELRITPYGRWNEMEFPQHFLPSNALEENSHWSIGVQSAVYHDAGKLSVITGVDAEYTEGALREFQERSTIFSFTQGLHYDYDVSAVNASVFLTADYALNSKTTVRAGVRVDGSTYQYENNAPDGIVGRFLRLPDQTDKFLTASPKVSIRHHFSDAFSGYASYARGARPPQTTDLYRLQINQTGDRARPELIDAFEAGFNASPAEAIQLSLAGYFMDKRNFFFRDADGFNVANGKTRHVGMEADVAITLHETFEIVSAVSWAAHTYRFNRATGNIFESIMSGADVDTAPRLLANTRVIWRPAPALTLEVEWRKIGEYFTDAANDHSYEGYDLVNIRGQAHLSDRLSAYVTLRNVGDTLYAERADFAFGRERFFPGEERTLGIGFRFQQ
ncbi:MAG: TonB-dependent receptor [Marinicaulis sp.]|nr:TonB-dependent receptor [Marinicaulis sp.]